MKMITVKVNTHPLQLLMHQSHFPTVSSCNITGYTIGILVQHKHEKSYLTPYDITTECRWVMCYDSGENPD